MFHFDRGLKLTKADLAIDFCRRQPRAFISHAHSDHMARHEYAICTPETARLYHLRLGKRAVLELPYRTPLEWGGLRLTTLPAGHCLGSAMLLAEDGEASLLYTGDFKLRESATAERAELPRADVLVIESTYGTPDYRLPPRDEAIAQLVGIVRTALERDQTPVVKAYALGKSQEVTAILTAHGFAVVQHKSVHDVSLVYEACGVALGAFSLVNQFVPHGHVLVTPPNYRRSAGPAVKVSRPVTIAVTGWAIDGRTRYRLGADHAVPLSDHADYDELFEAVERVAPREVYCTHGPVEFAERLREVGWNAFRLGAPHRQMRLPGVS